MRPRRLAVVAVAAVALVVSSAAAAAAHVSIQPGSAAKGSSSIFAFSVPNEEDAANTVKVEVTFPTKYPIASVSVKAMPGWTITTDTQQLARPVKTDDGKVTWTATDGGLAPGQFDLFTVSAGPLPTKPSRLEFPTVQTYSNGDVVRWIQPTVKGAPEPDNPVPVLKLAKGSGGHG
jgi:uncharacterized protein YcnI